MKAFDFIEYIYIYIIVCAFCFLYGLSPLSHNSLVFISKLLKRKTRQLLGDVRIVYAKVIDVRLLL